MNKELLHHASQTFLFVFCCVQSQLRVRSREKRGLIYTARYTRDTCKAMSGARPLRLSPLNFVERFGTGLIIAWSLPWSISNVYLDNENKELLHHASRTFLFVFSCHARPCQGSVLYEYPYQCVNPKTNPWICANVRKGYLKYLPETLTSFF